MILTKEQFVKLFGTFTWNFGNEYHIETELGNFIWKDPSYLGGDNTIRPTPMSSQQWAKSCNIPYGRSKGTQTIGLFCGNDFTLVQ